MALLICYILCVIFMIVTEKKRGDFGGDFVLGFIGLSLFFLMIAKTAYYNV